jgi:protein TonB
LPEIKDKPDTIAGLSFDTSSGKVPSGDDEMNFAKDTALFKMFTVEESPECINLLEVSRKIIYPEEAKENAIKGKVYIQALVGFNGDVIKLGSIYGPEVFYKEVKRVSMMLKFTIARVKGKPVKCWVTIPFNFKLSK